jgi:hypothetical protein
VAAQSGRTGGLHPLRISAKQRLHLAAFLIALIALPVFAQTADEDGDIVFDPNITQAEFETFSRLVAQGIYATPVDPARARGLLGFDIGIAVTAVPVDTAAPYWQRATENDFTVSDHVLVPKIVAQKGLSFATLSLQYSQVQDSDIQVWGGSLDVPIISGGIVKPTLAVRGAYAVLKGVDELDLTTYGVEVFLSKGFGPVTPYAAIGTMRSDAEGRVTPAFILTDESNQQRITLGVKVSLLFPKIIVEATQAEERSYAAKVSFGL